ncbi:MAG: hypothetical protein AB7O67_16725 [Vicinamibacterales bacterium]
MKWDIARRALQCRRCHETIGAGEQVRLVTSGRWPWCAACAKTELHEDPPADMPVIRAADRLKPPKTFAPDPAPSAWQGFDRAAMARSVRERILDARMRQAGDVE